MVDTEVPLHHKLLQVAIAMPKPEIPANAQDDDLGFEMPSFEHCWPDSSHARASLANRRRPICNTSRSTECETVQRHRPAAIRNHQSQLLSFDSLHFRFGELALATTGRATER